MITKSEELRFLDNTIAALGPDSYLGPWLAQVRGEVESNIRSDFFPMITLADASAAALAIVNEAALKAEKIIAEAQQKAASTIEDALRTRTSVASAIRAAESAINRW